MIRPKCCFCGRELDCTTCDGSEEVVAIFHCGTEFVMQSRQDESLVATRGEHCKSLEKLRLNLIACYLRSESYRFELENEDPDV